MPLTIGLTGGIGAGKSTVAKLLADCGAEVVEGDMLGKEAIDLQPQLQQAIRERFGNRVFSSSGELDRKALGEMVFTNETHVRWLTDVTFPYINEKWQQAVIECRKQVIIFDAALIFEWGIQREFDKVVVVTASKELVSRRSISGRFDPQTIAQRLKYQIPIERKIEQADIVIDNSGTIGELSERIESLYQSWLQLK